MAIGALPQNQIDSLPLMTVTQAQQASTVLRSPAGVLKMFTATDLQLNAAAPQTINTQICLVTPYLDLSFCNRFRFTLRRTASDGLAKAVLPACTLNVQSRQFPGDTPAVIYTQGGAVRPELSAYQGITSGSLVFLALANAEQQTGVWAWGDSVGSSNTQSQGTGLGGNSRFIVSWSTNPVPAGNVFTAYLDAQT